MPIIAIRKLLLFAAFLFALAITACAGAFLPAEESLSLLPEKTLTAQQLILSNGSEGDLSLDSYAGEWGMGLFSTAGSDRSIAAGNSFNFENNITP